MATRTLLYLPIALSACAAVSAFAPAPALVRIGAGSPVTARHEEPGTWKVSAFSAVRKCRLAAAPALRMSADPKPVNVKPTKHDIATGRDPARVKVFDTTLRDGEQSPGCLPAPSCTPCAQMHYPLLGATEVVQPSDSSANSSIAHEQVQYDLGGEAPGRQAVGQARC